MYCRKCGKELQVGVKFCSACGEKIELSEPVKKSEAKAENKSIISKLCDNGMIWWWGGIIGFALICAFLYLYFYYIRDTVKDLDYNCVSIKDNNKECVFYIDGDTVLVASYTTESGPSFSTYESDGKLWYVNGYQEPYEFIEEMPDKELFTKILYEIPNLKSRRGIEAVKVQIDWDKLTNIKKLYSIFYKMDYNQEEPNKYGDVSVRAGGEEYVWIEIEGNILKLEYYKMKEDDAVEIVKKRVSEMYDQSYLEGEYYQADTGDTLNIDDSNVYVEDDYTVSMVVTLNGEEKHFPYNSCQWSEAGCIIDGVEYTMNEEYARSKEIEAERDRLYSILSGGDFYVHWSLNDNESIEFESIYVEDDAFCVDATIGGETKKYYLGEYGGYIGLIEADSEHPETFRMMEGLKEGNVDYHRFYPVK